MSLALHFLASLALCVSFHGNALAADSGSAQDLVIADVKGDVRLFVRDEPRAAQKGNTVELRATIRTGRASSIELRQGQTTVATGADTHLDIPATAVRGDLLERVVQSSGNTFYSVAKRGAKKFRVETPYLVAVVKGTQFNVSVQEDASTVSLFEGQLEIRSADGSDVVNIEAGEIAVRRASDSRIRVLRMDTGEPVARNADRTQTLPGQRSSVDAIEVPEGPTNAAAIGTRVDIDGRVGLQSEASSAPVSVNAAVNLDDGVGLQAEVSVTAAVDLGAGAVDVTVDVGVASANVGASAGVDLNAGSVGIGVDTAITLGAASATVDVGSGVDLGAGTVDVGAGLDANVGGVTATAGLDSAVDLGAGTVSAGVDAGVDLGGAVTAGLTSDTSVDLTTGTIDTGTTLTAGGTTVGADVNVGGGAIGADVTAGPIDLGLGVDLGNGGGITLDVGGSTSTGGSTTIGSTVGSTVGSVVSGLLGTIGGRRGRP